MIDPHFHREDRTVRWRRIAATVRQHPEALQTAFKNLARWEALGRVHVAPLHEWRRRILAAQATREGWRDLILFLETPDHQDVPLMSCSPFVGPEFARPPGHSAADDA